MNMQYDCIVWFDPLVWGNGDVTLISLIEKAKKLKQDEGFAIVLFTPDDIIELRDEIMYCSRDNVWLEYGLFVGIIDRSRVFAVCPCSPVVKSEGKLKWRKPSDFQQYALSYEYNNQLKDSEYRLKEIATEIADRINRQFPCKFEPNQVPDNNGDKLFDPSY